VDKAEAQKVASTLVMRLKGLLEFNEALVAPLPCALAKEPGERGPFDTITIQHLEENLEKRLEELNKLIREAGKVKEERATEVRNAHEAFEAARERQLVAAQTFTAFRKEE